MLTIAVFDLDQANNKTFKQVDGGELPVRNAPDAWNWNKGISVVTQDVAGSKAMILNVPMAPGATFTFNAMVDAGTSNAHWLCKANLTPTVIVGAVWNGVQAAQVAVVPNGNYCNLQFVAAALASCPGNDQDCDGYTSDSPDQSKKDCNDLNPLVRPGQLESWGDNIDTNCDGHNDPNNWRYTAGSWGSGYVTVLVDESTYLWNDGNGDAVYGTTYPMTFVAGAGYRVDIQPWKAPKNFRARSWQNGKWAYSTYSWNGCQKPSPLSVVDALYGTPIDKNGFVPLEDPTCSYQTITLP